MDATRWRTVSEIVADAMDLPADGRRRLLDERCASDRELRAECESLLAQERHVEQRLGARAAAFDVLAGPEGARSPESLVGEKAGAWSVVSELGRGGMGAVFLATRQGDGFVQRGALKVLASFSGAAARERFRIEQRALARLEHPGIARLIDAGELADGRPFLVMELVEGAPIDRWCSERRLELRERLELFAQVCDAVHHAHQNLVVHRDLKPSNVLVDSSGRPRVVDFGIARVLEEHASVDTTRELPRAFTPRYASPEQVRGESVSTASDVYSLGVLLYELLVGVSPYQGATRSTHDVERAVRELDPPRPSVAAASSPACVVAPSQLRGDLDAVVLQALSKAPERRYGTAGELALDVRRHLRGESVGARPDTLGYRLATLVRRHRLASALAAALAVALVAGVAASTAAYWKAKAASELERQQRERAEDLYEQAQAARAQEQRQRDLADRRYRDLRELARSLVFDAHDAVRVLPGATRARESLLESAQRLLERLEEHGADDPELLVDLARSYVRLGEVRGRAAESSIGHVRSAEDALRHAVELALQARGRSERADYVQAQAQAKLGELLTMEGRLEEARAELEQAFATRAALLDSSPERWADDPDLGYLNERLFDLALAQGSLEAAEQRLAASDEFFESAVESGRFALLWRENRAVNLGHRAKLAELRRELESALELRQRAVTALRELAETAADRVWNRQRLGQAQGDLGVLLARLGRRDEARPHLDQALRAQQELVALDPASASYRADLAMTKIYMAELEAAGDERERSLTLFREALELRRALAEDDPTSARALRAQAVAADQVGGALRKLGRFGEAYEHHVEAAGVFERLAAAPGAGPDAKRSVAVSCYALGQLQRSRAEAALTEESRVELWESAREHYARGLAIIESLADAGLLAPRDKGVPDLLRRELEACDAASAQR